MIASHGGVFNLHPGSGALPLHGAERMNRPLWIGTRSGNSDEMCLLTRLSSAPYALNVADNAITSGKLASGAVTSDKIAVDYIAASGSCDPVNSAFTFKATARP
jgi:hypothetical protein